MTNIIGKSHCVALLACPQIAGKGQKSLIGETRLVKTSSKSVHYFWEEQQVEVVSFDCNWHYIQQLPLEHCHMRLNSAL